MAATASHTIRWTTACPVCGADPLRIVRVSPADATGAIQAVRIALACAACWSETAMRIVEDGPELATELTVTRRRRLPGGRRRLGPGPGPTAAEPGLDEIEFDRLAAELRTKDDFEDYDPEATGAASPALHWRVVSSCAGFATPASGEELYHALHAETPTGRQKALVAMWTQEATDGEVLRGWVQAAYTFRELVAAMHRCGCTRNWERNRFLARRVTEPKRRNA